MSTAGMTKPSVDRELCVGHGRCYALAPDLFASDDDGYSLVIGVASDAESQERLKSARRNCPEGAVGVAAT